ncbi:MAG: bifunctional diguanylate cyclase/phosphodiesterase [Nitrospiraceae bacterium]|nr:MAG: bifunctional diguanylate cyclase/phosphodiesterase [Nitrospiraceae bacterium]
MKGLKNFIVLGTIIGTVTMFSIVYLLVSYWHEDNVRTEAHDISKNIADTTSNTIFHVMKKGWSRNDVKDVLETNRELFKKAHYSVEVYRGEIVEKLYGRIKQPLMDKEALEVLHSGDEKVLETKNTIRYLYPLKAKTECLECHTNAGTADVLGIIDVENDLAPTINAGKKRVSLILLLIFPVPIFGALIVSSIVSRKITGSLNTLQKRVESINSVKDLKLLAMNDIDLAFREFNALFDGFKNTVQRLRDVAIDKDILEFEIRLLEKFIITSELVKDWKDHIKHILIEINRIMEAYCLFSLFVMNDETYDIEIFWRNTPSLNTRETIERIIRQKLMAHPYFRNLNGLNIVHNVVLPLSNLPELNEDALEMQTKTLMLDSPRIGGIIGIGVNVDLSFEPTRALVIEGVLTTLLNVVGSVKAIYKYTKDLEYYATRDPLTNLFNQRVFWELLDYETERARRHNYKFSVLVIDIDNFKVINDIYGHIFGDKFLQGVSAIIRNIFRKEDMVARYGGDEFAGVILDSDEENAYLVAKRIKEGLKEFSLKAPDGVAVKATVSIGIAVFPSHAGSPKDLFLLADSMVGSAKSSGKDRILIPSTEDIADVFKHVSEKNIIIMSAIEEKKIIPYFQPIMNVKTKQIEAYETLMRIELDDKIMSAAEFVELATDIGVINKMDTILMEKVFEKASEMNYTGNLFLNISPKALIFSEFLPNIRSMVKNYRINPARIVFEITERDTVRNLSLLEKFVLDLKFEGFKFAIDDFGSGFSSFQYIKLFPIDFVKVEGDFIRSMIGSGNEVNMAIVNSISTFTAQVGIKTIAEYVEDEEILKTIGLMGIDYAQGYHIGKPAPELKHI